MVTVSPGPGVPGPRLEAAALAARLLEQGRTVHGPGFELAAARYFADVRSSGSASAWRLQRLVARHCDGLPPERAAALNRWLAVALVASFDAGAIPLRLPAAIRDDFARAAARLLAAAADGPDCDFVPSGPVMSSRVPLFSGCMVPIGPALAEYRSSVLRAMFRRRDPRQAWPLARAVFAARGPQPFLNVHWPRRPGQRFEPSGFRATFLPAAALLRYNPRLRGICAGAWMLDPRLDVVAPRLAWVRHELAANGAHFVRLGPGAGASAGLAASRTLRALADNGAYVPETWMMVWPRRAVLRWAGRSALEAQGEAAETEQP